MIVPFDFNFYIYSTVMILFWWVSLPPSTKASDCRHQSITSKFTYQIIGARLSWTWPNKRSKVVVDHLLNPVGLNEAYKLRHGRKKSRPGLGTEFWHRVNFRLHTRVWEKDWRTSSPTLVKTPPPEILYLRARLWLIKGACSSQK